MCRVFFLIVSNVCADFILRARGAVHRLGPFFGRALQLCQHECVQDLYELAAPHPRTCLRPCFGGPDYSPSMVNIPQLRLSARFHFLDQWRGETVRQGSVIMCGSRRSKYTLQHHTGPFTIILFPERTQICLFCPHGLPLPHTTDLHIPGFRAR